MTFHTRIQIPNKKARKGWAICGLAPSPTSGCGAIVKGALRVLHAALQNKNPGIAFWQCDATKMNASKTRAVAACYRYQTNSGAVA